MSESDRFVRCDPKVRQALTGGPVDEISMYDLLGDRPNPALGERDTDHLRSLRIRWTWPSATPRAGDGPDRLRQR